MILGVGVDVVRVSRVQAAVDRFGVRFSRRILTGEELGDLPGPRRAAQFLAKRFAAKEALVKALGTGFRYGVGPRDIGVRHEASDTGSGLATSACGTTPWAGRSWCSHPAPRAGSMPGASPRVTSAWPTRKTWRSPSSP